MSLIALRGAVDFETGQSLKNAKQNDDHHLFPQKSGIVDENRVNSVLNRTWLSSETNQKISNKKPSLYISKFLENDYKTDSKFFEVVKTHLIDNECYQLMKEDNFEEFLNARDKLLVDYVKNMIGWMEGESSQHKLGGTNNLLEQDEDDRLEYKSTFKKNLATGKADDTMKYEVLKSIAGFLNAKGGKLIIGYNEKKKEVTGIETDFELSKWKDRDSFVKEFWDYLKANIDKEILDKNVKVSFSQTDGKEIMIVEIKRSDKPVFLINKGKKVLYKRSRNETEHLEDPEEIHKYVSRAFLK